MAAHMGITASASRVVLPDDIPPFDPGTMAKHPGFLSWCFSGPRRVRALFWLSNLLSRWSGKYFVTRYDEVREAFNHDVEFPVGWGHRMLKDTSDNDGTHGDNFVLGMEQGATYRRCYAELARAFPREEVYRHTAHSALLETRAVIRGVRAAARPGTPIVFDAIEALIHGIPTRLCGRYYGIPIEDETLFARWTLASSAFTFGLKLDGDTIDRGLAASAHLRHAIRRGIAQEVAGIAAHGNTPGPIKAQPVIRHMLEAGLSEDQVHAHMFGMVLGYIPTNVLAGGNILETLLRRPEFLERTRAAAESGDDERLWRCLRETLRFRNINPGMWRTCPNDYVFATGRRIRGHPKTQVIISAQAAMFDKKRIERPYTFDPDRPDDDYMVFGVGQHWCIGAYIAQAQLTQTFKEIVQLRNLRPARGRCASRFADIFPMQLRVAFDP
jgi:cytochrome P450